MPKYMISFDDGWMDVPRDDLAEVTRAAHAVVDEAKAARVGREDRRGLPLPAGGPGHHGRP